jgi:hypothetical protein
MFELIPAVEIKYDFSINFFHRNKHAEGIVKTIFYYGATHSE